MGKLPNYGKPPVVEVAMGVQFAPLEGLTVAHVGLYWATIRDTFTASEEQGAIEHTVEPEGDVPRRTLRVKFLEKPELPRTWFIDKTETRIIQVQRDRFLHNWRKTKPFDEYPRFFSVRDSFLEHWGGFAGFLETNRMAPQLDQCELTYVNLIPKGQGWQTIADLGKVFSTFAWRTRDNFLPAPENARWSLRFSLPEKQGRLHVEVIQVRVPPQNDPAIRFSLTVRGRPRGDFTTDNVRAWFELAHQWIVLGFVDLVDRSTDALWEKHE